MFRSGNLCRCDFAHEGETSGLLYVLVDGEVEIVKGDLVGDA